MQDTPKQTRLLGATVRGLGVVVAVSSSLHFGYAIVEAEGWVNHRVALTDLRREEVVFPAAPQPYRTQVERVAVGTWDEVHTLVPGVVGLWSRVFEDATTPKDSPRWSAGAFL